MSRLIGIDLGTTHSCVAVMDGAAPRVVPNQEGERFTPSVVAFTPNGERLVGQSATRHSLIQPGNTVFAVMRLLGRRFDSEEVDEARRFLPFELVAAANGNVHVQVADKVYSPTEICSVLLEELKTGAEEELGEPVEQAVITCPAYFNDSRRQALKDAALIAGLEVAHIVNGATAAALAYGLNPSNRGGFVAVYDLGGGTFDISILEIAEGLFQVRATGGDTSLGGEDFDRRIVDWLVSQFLRETGIDLLQDRVARQRLKEAAEKAKCELSSAQQAEIALPSISADGSGARHLNAVLTRQEYESLTHGLVERTIDACRRCLADASLGADQIDEVLLVGGQTRAPQVSDVVRRFFGKEPNRSVNPDEGAALGAAILTGTITGDVRDVVMLDVTPLTLGLETADGQFAPVIERNSTIPTRASRFITTVADNQTRIEVHLLQGESDMAVYNKSLARFDLTEIPPAPKGVPQIEAAFTIDVRGVVSVSANDQATGWAQDRVIRISGGLIEPEVSRLADEARDRRMARQAAKAHEALVGRLDGLLANTAHSVLVMESKLTPREHERILSAIEKGKNTRREGDTAELRMRVQDLETAATLIGQAILRP